MHSPQSSGRGQGKRAKAAITIGVATTLVVGAAIALAQPAFQPKMESNEVSSPIQDAPPLKDSFKGKFLIGTAVSTSLLKGQQPATEALIKKHFNVFTAENSMKPEGMQPREGEFQFEDADRLVKIAQEAGGHVVGHTLAWHAQTPRWFFQGEGDKPVTKEVALARLRNHIKTIVGRYKGKIREWDVVNEAINDGPGVYRQTPWIRALGEDYIAEAFRAAHEADPDAILIYNDYNIELEYKRPKALELLKKLIAQKVPIHAVGIQSHWRIENMPLAEMEKSIQEYSALGLKVMITELDLGVLPTKYQGADISRTEAMTPEQAAVVNPYTAGLPAEVAKLHGEKYREAFALFKKYEKQIGRVTFWGTHDGESWLNGFPIRGRTDYPLLFDRKLQPKPAFFAVKEVIGK